jgi:hypothetical protein
MVNECAAVYGMRIDRGNISLRRNSGPVPSKEDLISHTEDSSFES